MLNGLYNNPVTTGLSTIFTLSDINTKNRAIRVHGIFKANANGNYKFFGIAKINTETDLTAKFSFHVGTTV